MRLDIVIWDFYERVDGQAYWDYWLDCYAQREHIHIVRVVTVEDTEEAILNSLYGDWDYLLIFEKDMRAEFDEMFSRLNLPFERVIYAMRLVSWLNRPKNVSLLVKDNIYQRCLDFWQERRHKKYLSCDVEGCHYIASSADDAIMRSMYINQKNWSGRDMAVFRQLAAAYYGTTDGSGYFLDIGANIGTTSIYFKKNIDAGIKILAFEPDSENYRFLRINCLLNHMEEYVVLENIGLGDKEEQRALHKNVGNPGGNSILHDYDAGTEIIRITTLDQYLERHSYCLSEIKYIWIDTEGFEPCVLHGARQLLKKCAIPIFMEFNPQLWETAGLFEMMMEFLRTYCMGVIYISEALESGTKAPIHAVDEIERFRAKEEAETCKVDDIFLILRQSKYAQKLCHRERDV